MGRRKGTGATQVRNASYKKNKTLSHDKIFTTGYSISSGNETYPYTHYHKENILSALNKTENIITNRILENQRRVLQRYNYNAGSMISFSKDEEDFLNNFTDPNYWGRQSEINKIYRGIVSNLNSAAESLKISDYAQCIEETRQLREKMEYGQKISAEVLVETLEKMSEGYKILNEVDGTALLVLIESARNKKNGQYNLNKMLQNLSISRENFLNSKEGKLTLSEEALDKTYLGMIKLLNLYLGLDNDQKNITKGNYGSYISNIMNKDIGEYFIAAIVQNVLGDFIKDLRVTGKESKTILYEDDFGEIKEEKIQNIKADQKGVYAMSVKGPDGKNITVNISLGFSSKLQNKKQTSALSGATTIEKGAFWRILKLFETWSEKAFLMSAYGQEDQVDTNFAKEAIKNYVFSRYADSFLAGGRGSDNTDLVQIFVINGKFYYIYDLLLEIFSNSDATSFHLNKRIAWIDNQYKTNRNNKKGDNKGDWVDGFNRNKRLYQALEKNSFTAEIHIAKMKNSIN